MVVEGKSDMVVYGGVEIWIFQMLFDYLES